MVTFIPDNIVGSYREFLGGAFIEQTNRVVRIKYDDRKANGVDDGLGEGGVKA
jgi:hypothetical protein